MIVDSPKSCDLCGGPMEVRRSVLAAMERSVTQVGPVLAWFCGAHGERETVEPEGGRPR